MAKEGTGCCIFQKADKVINIETECKRDSGEDELDGLLGSWAKPADRLGSSLLGDGSEPHRLKDSKVLSCHCQGL
jgi:hypothetical protein